MPLHATNLDDDIVFVTAVDAITFTEMMEMLAHIYQGASPLRILWDFREGTAVNLKYDHLVAMADYVSKFSEKRKRGKTALVILRDVDYGIFRTLATFKDIKEIPFILQAFHDYDEALRWLKSGEPF